MTDDARRAAEMAAQTRLVAATVELTAVFPGVAVRSELVRGPAVDVLVEISRRAGLLVVGRSGGHRAGGGALGRVAVALVDRARCPLLVSHSRSAHRAGLESPVGLSAALTG